MDLRTKTLVIIGIYLLLVIASFVVYSATTWERSFSSIESGEVQDDLHRVVFAVDHERSDLDSSLADWSMWDDTYYFSLGSNPGYAESNLMPATYQTLDLDMVLIYDPAGDLVYAREYNPSTGGLEDVPAGLVEGLDRDASLFSFSPADDTAAVSGLYSFGNRTVILAARPILQSNGEGPAEGTLVMIRSFDQDFMGYLSESTGVQVALYAPWDMAGSGALAAVGDRLATDPSPQVVPGNSTSISAYMPLEGLVPGETSYILAITEPRVIYQSGLSTIWSFMVILLFSGLFFGLLGILVVDHTVLRRLNTLLSGVREVKEKGGAARVPALPGDDELSHLSGEINGMLDTISAIHERYRSIVEDQTEYICRFTTDGAVTFTNPAFSRAFSGLSPAGKFSSIYDLPPDIFSREEFHTVIGGLSPGKPMASGKNEFTLSGARTWVAWTIRGIFDDEGVFREYQFVGRDVTAEEDALVEIRNYRDHLEDLVRERTESLMAAQQELQKVERMESIGLLAGGIAHDFNNLLFTILGNIEIMEDRLEPDSPLRPQIARLRGEVLRARSLTSQLLTFSRGGAPIKKLADITGVVRETAEFVCRGSKVKCDFTAGDNVAAVSADTDQISQVVTNLVLNAIQAMPDGGTVGVEVRNALLEAEERPPLLPGPYVKVAVSDHGKGIPPAVLGWIFEPFFTTKPKGGGLGLATSFSIVRKHGGHIFVSSAEGKGTTFSVYLPAMSEDAALPDTKGHPELSAGQPHSLPSGRILVMDDEEAILILLSEMLQTKGFEVVTAEDGKEAIDHYKRAMNEGRPFDVVIMDLTVPGGMGGKETIQVLRELDPGIRAIVSSGYFTDPVMADYEKFGFSGVIPKPFPFADLYSLITRLMGEK
ncbi:PAS domain S-box-containing protein [Methanolinea mesophila]|uniref:CHASE4 domain-containing protein n=1 Tax=Methanolinea mesophila TaxID=547055 RepID=UPI001AE0FBAC|nr:CHASE4 domain-containing protein [Methanolinea mesophila]MBP1928886.1 PAS domain S-box-containing protein [Methanolinea mesophila]